MSCYVSLAGSLNAKQLLQTIAPHAQAPHLPPGFSPLEGISTEKFRYRTNNRTISVTANLLDDEIVELFPGQITVSDIKLKFEHQKGTKSKKDWDVSIKGTTYLIFLVIIIIISFSLICRRR